ncbi:DMT family transporter [Halostella sp. JP-L12]|uniref:DMT family transporter n=1 Tax=Halostella TaxID=1843185 RepID=UPI000EF80935|nr:MULTISPECIES: DMT family transporter [Halostella]NHN49402.1 DMT family transporter [Halostella sp. JP-L12]
MIAQHRTRLRVPAGLAIVGLGLLWGAGFPAIDVVVSQLPPLGAAGIRYAVSGGIVLAYAAATTDRLLPRARREVLGVAVVGGFVFGGYQGGLYVGTQYVSGAVAAVVTTMSPVVAALVAVPVLGESRGLSDVCGFCLGLAGVVVISQPSLGAAALPSRAIGVGLVFLGTALFAVGSVSVQLFDGDLPSEALQGWAMLVGAALLFGGAVLRGESVPPIRSMTPVGLGALLYITLVAGAGGYLLYFRLVRCVGATETTLVAYLEPVSATFVSVLVFGRSIEAATVVGFLAVAAGFTIVSRDTMRRAIAEIRAPGSNADLEPPDRGD